MFVMSILFIIAVIVEVTAQSFWQIVIGNISHSKAQGITPG